MKRLYNKLKSKINKYCSFASDIQLNFLSPELRLNLKRCLDEKIPLRIFQMEKMVIRSEDACIMMNVVVPAKERHTSFNKFLVDKYNYECKRDKLSYYVFSLFEAICFQCGFCTWEDIRKYIASYLYIKY